MSQKFDTSALTVLVDNFVVGQGIAKSHQRAREDLLRQAEFEKQGAEDAHNRAIKAMQDGLKENAIEGVVPKVVSLSYEQVILALPDDYLWVRQRRGEGRNAFWEELTYGPPIETEEVAALHVLGHEPKDGGEREQVKTWLKVNSNTRVASDGRTMRYPRVGVAPNANRIPDVSGYEAPPPPPRSPDLHGSLTEQENLDRLFELQNPKKEEDEGE